MNPLHIVVVSPDPGRREELVGLLQRGTHRSTGVSDGSAAADLIDGGVDAVVLDLALLNLDRALLRRTLSAGDVTEPDSLDAAERRHLSLVLRHTGGNKRRAAHILGISRSTLLNKVRKYGLEDR